MAVDQDVWPAVYSASSIYANAKAQWNFKMSVLFLEYHFVDICEGKILLFFLCEMTSLHTVHVSTKLSSAAQRGAHVGSCWLRSTAQMIFCIKYNLLSTFQCVVEYPAQEKATWSVVWDLLPAARTPQQGGDSFNLVPPTRDDVVEWLAEAWQELLIATISSNFHQSSTV